MNEGGGERQTLLPATGQNAGAPLQVGFEVGEGDDCLEAVAQAPGGQAIDPSEEFEILACGQVFVEGELLAHVANPATDLFSLGSHIKAQNPCCSTTGGQQPAKNPD